MKLILTENIRGLGSTGDLVKVRDGFARNYLLPKKMAVAPTEDNAKKFRKEREGYLLREKGKIESAKLMASKLEGVSVAVKMKANDAGHLFGSVTEAIVAEALSAQIGHSVDAHQVILGSHYKHIGDYQVIVRLHSEVEVELDLHVQAEIVVENEGVPAKVEAAPAEPAAK